MRGQSSARGWAAALLVLIFGGCYDAPNPNIYPEYPLPADGSTVLTAAPLLSWEEFENGMYAIQVSYKGSDTEYLIVDESSLEQPQYQFTTPLANGTTYYWRVRLESLGYGELNWSPTWSFTTQL